MNPRYTDSSTPSLQILKQAGPDGAPVEVITEGLAAARVKTWPDAKAAKASIASICGHDIAFVRVGRDVFALRAITHLPEASESPDNGCLPGRLQRRFLGAR